MQAAGLYTVTMYLTYIAYGLQFASYTLLQLNCLNIKNACGLGMVAYGHSLIGLIPLYTLYVYLLITHPFQVEAMELIAELAEALPSVDGSKMLGELSDYSSEENFFSKPLIWKAAKQTTSTSWWKGICGSTQLSQVAARIMSMPPTSAAVERSFSRHAWIHSAKRNRLTTERAGKLVFIAHNIELCDQSQQC